MQKQEQIKEQSSPPDSNIYHFFIFINTKSGFGEGKQYLKHDFTQIKYKYESNRVAFVYLCDLFVTQAKQLFLRYIKELHCKKTENIRVVISGGDGTILWVVTQVMNMGVDINDIVFVINPIGTGNDFSRSLGWGCEPLIKVTKDYFRQQLAKQILIWMNSKTGKYDLWDVQIDTYSHGQIYDVKNQIEIRRNQTHISKIFCNYVGMGLDARVVYTVQRKRTKNAMVNKVIYGCVGFCNFFKSLKNLDTMSFATESQTSSAMITEQGSDSLKMALDQPCASQKSGNMETDNSDAEQMFSNKGLKLGKRLSSTEDETMYSLKKGYRGMVCLNCTSYMCGLRDIWGTRKIAEQNSMNEHFNQQKYDDGKVEFIVYKNQLDLALERIMRSSAKFVQGAGPFKIVLPQTTDPDQRQTFIQIDGQSIKVMDLKQIRIKKTDKIAGSQLNVLVNIQEGLPESSI